MKFINKIITLSIISAFFIVTACGAKTPSIVGDKDANKEVYHTVYLYQETKSDAGRWFIDPATSVIPIKNLKWNAKILDIKSTAPQKATVNDREVGTYYLKIKTGLYILPGNKVKISFTVNQDKKYQFTNLSVILNFVKRPTPFSKFMIGNTNMANKFVGVKTVKLNLNAAEKEIAGTLPITIKMTAGYKRIKNVYTNKRGVAHTFANGNKLRIANLTKIQVVYQATAKTVLNELGGYYKSENCAYNGCKKLFPVRYVATLEF